MLTVAYLANQFPSPVEPYVGDEIEELRRRGVCVVTGSVRRAESSAAEAEIVLQTASVATWMRALWLCVRRWRRILPLFGRIVLRGREDPATRLKAVVHTLLGACYAVLLRDRAVDHVHVHHGYFGSWIAMVAARLQGIGYSLTLHGSDLLLHGKYLDTKLEHCRFCVTVSDYNRGYIVRTYPHVNPEKVMVARLGAGIPDHIRTVAPKTSAWPFTIVAVGRLHAVKDHAFLVRACAQLRAQDVPFECLIAGDGPEHQRLTKQIRECGLDRHVTLLGHVPRAQMDSLYDRADVVVLTSRSEGIPLVLMEAMARARIVVAPDVTGIPELVISGKTGFLYEPGNLHDFVERLLLIRALAQASGHPDLHRQVPSAGRQLDWIRHAARVQVQQNFNRSANLRLFGEMFLQRIAPQIVSIPHEDFILQQI